MDLEKIVSDILEKTEVIDLHTHLFPPEFEELYLSGIDELLTYHYIVAEFFKYQKTISPNEFFDLPKCEQADSIWDVLFVKNSPISEACQGIIKVLNILGLKEELKSLDLKKIREWFLKQTTNKPMSSNSRISMYIDKIMKLSGVKYIYMTNNPFDPIETKYWLNDYFTSTKYFKTCIRIDEIFSPNKIVTIIPMIFNNFMIKPKYHVTETDILSCTNTYIHFITDYFENWYSILKPEYIMMSLPYDFNLDQINNHLIFHNIIIPFSQKYKLPIFLKLGTDRQVNPELKQAGDSLGIANMHWLSNMCKQYTEIKFIVTVLSIENQHQLLVLSRKFPNLHIYGCWWFCNTHSMINEITQRRIELLGTSFTFQHSDSRILEQLIYKWIQSKAILKDILITNYNKLISCGYPLTIEHIQKDIYNLTGGKYLEFINT